MRLLLLPSLLLLATACGDDGADTSCGGEGTATGEAEAGGAPLGPFARASLQVTPPHPGGAQLALILDESPGTCGEASTGRRVIITFCDTPVVAAYKAVPALNLRCPLAADADPTVGLLVEEPDGTDVATATGTLDVIHAGGCLAAHYELTIGASMLVGDTDAVVCD